MTFLSVVIHTQNSKATLPVTLESVKWADEMIVVDMESNDGSRELAEASRARIFDVSSHQRVDGIRNRFLDEAAGQWILVIDSDEYLASDGEENIRRLVREFGDAFDAFDIPRFNWFGGRRLEGSGWYPDYQTRLFRKGTVRWSDTVHHKPTVLTGKERLKRLAPPDCLHIHHQNYENLEHFIRKQLNYALDDRYSHDASIFDFSDSIAQAFREYHRRYDPQHDGDLSVALATVMAWDKVIRGIIHWDRLGQVPPLEGFYSLPVVLKRRSLVRRLVDHLKRASRARSIKS